MRNAKTTNSRGKKKAAAAAATEQLSQTKRWSMVYCAIHAIRREWYESQQWKRIKEWTRIKTQTHQNRCWCFYFYFYLLKLSLVWCRCIFSRFVVENCGVMWYDVAEMRWPVCANEMQSQTSNKNDRRTPYEKCLSNGMPARMRRNEYAERWISVGSECTADESMCTHESMCSRTFDKDGRSMRMRMSLGGKR